MISKSTIILALSTLALVATLYSLNQPSAHSLQLQSEDAPNTLQFTFKSISSILRTSLSRVYSVNDTIYAGDNVGSIAIWSYDAKKKKLEYQDVSRQIAAVLPPENKVVHLEADNGGVVVLTADGKLTAYVINAQTKITGNVQIALSDTSSWFTLIKINSTNSSGL